MHKFCSTDVAYGTEFIQHLTEGIFLWQQDMNKVAHYVLDCTSIWSTCAVRLHYYVRDMSQHMLSNYCKHGRWQLEIFCFSS